MQSEPYVNNRVFLLGAWVDPMGQQQAIKTILAWCAAKAGRYVVTPNLEHCRMLQLSTAFKQAYANASLVLADGWPLVAASRFTSCPLKHRVTGSDLIVPLSRACALNGYSVFLLGATDEVLRVVSEKLQQENPSLVIAGTDSTPLGFERDGVELAKIDTILKAAQPHVVFVAFGSPRQEVWMAGHIPYLPVGVAIGIGAGLDFIAGKQKRAPQLLRYLGMEWLWRVILEPKRLGKRYALCLMALPKLCWMQIKHVQQSTVLFITPGGRTAPGGITRMVDYCLRAWPSSSPFRLRVIDSYGPGAKSLMPFFALSAFVRALCLLLLHRIDILHINMSERLSIWRKGVFILLGNCFRVPVIVHLHGAEFEDYVLNASARKKRWIAGVLNRAQKLIVLGIYWRDFLVRELTLSPDRIAILSNAVPDATRLKKQTNKKCQLLFLGALGERKGVSVLLKALGSPAMATLSWHMTIAGGGDVETYKRMTSELGIDKRVTFTGLLSEEQARGELSHADILVLPSKREGLPMAILEALSYGCPVVATPVGAIADAVIHGQTGLLVPVGDSDALASALAQLIGDATYREYLGAQARALYEKKFTLTAYNGALEAIYHAL